MENLPVGIPLAHQPWQTDLGLLAIATFLGICIYSWISGYCHFNSCPLVRPLHWCCRAQSFEEVDTLISFLPAKRIAKWVSWYTLHFLCAGQVCIRFGKEVSWFFLTIYGSFKSRNTQFLLALPGKLTFIIYIQTWCAEIYWWELSNKSGFYEVTLSL